MCAFFSELAYFMEKYAINISRLLILKFITSVEKK